MHLEDLLKGIESSRSYFHKHIQDLPEEAWTWKPYPQCKNVLETLAHMRVDDLTALESLQTGEEPHYEEIGGKAYLEIRHGKDHLLKLLAESRQELVDHLRANYGGADMETPICVWGSMKPIDLGIPYYSSEDFYHAGQVAFIRLAVQPEWDYYSAIYGITF
jgi:hypothetical protein